MIDDFGIKSLRDGLLRLSRSFLCDRKFLSHKMLRKDRTAAVRKYVAKRPAAGGESCEQDSFLYDKRGNGL